MYYSGSDGFLEFNNQRIGRVANWQLDAGRDLTDVSRVGDCEKTFIPGAVTYSGSASIWYYEDTPAPLLGVLFTTGEPSKDAVTFTLGWGGLGRPLKKVVFNAFITQSSFGCSTGEVMQTNISFNVTGSLSEVLL